MDGVELGGVYEVIRNIFGGGNSYDKHLLGGKNAGPA